MHSRTVVAPGSPAAPSPDYRAVDPLLTSGSPPAPRRGGGISGGGGAAAKAKQVFRFHPAVLATMVLLTVACFGLGYRSGGAWQRQSTAAGLQRVVSAEAEVAARLAECERTREDLERQRREKGKDGQQGEGEGEGDTELVALQRRLAAARASVRESNAAYSRLFDQQGVCESQREALAERLAAAHPDDAAARARVEELTAAVDAAQYRLEALRSSGGGASALFLSERIANLRRAYEQRCLQSPGCVLLSDAELLERWPAANATAADAHRRQGEDGAWGSLDVSASAGDATDYSATYRDAPLSYFGRSASEEPIVRTPAPSASSPSPDSPAAPPAVSPLYFRNAAEAFDALMDAGLCAVMTDNAALTFPSLFVSLVTDAGAAGAGRRRFPPPVPAAGFLHQLVRTPLVRLCVGCDPRGWRLTFAAACDRQSATARRHYGGRAYWEARRLLQPTAAVSARARDVLSGAAGTGAGPVMAIDARAGGPRCGSPLRPAALGVHAAYLRRRFPNHTSIAEAASPLQAADPHAACNPSAAQVMARARAVAAALPRPPALLYVLAAGAEEREALRSELRRLRAAEPSSLPEVVFADVGVPAALDKETDARGAAHAGQNDADAGGGAAPPYTLTPPVAAAGRTDFELAVAWETAGAADVLLLNAFTASSRRAQEAFLLRRNLTLEDNTIFYI